MSEHRGNVNKQNAENVGLIANGVRSCLSKAVVESRGHGCVALVWPLTGLIGCNW